MNVSSLFLRTAVVIAIFGMGLGIVMAASHDYTLMPVHAHMNVIGWVSFFLFGLYYRFVPAAALGLLPRVHYGLSTAGILLMTVFLALLVTGAAWAEPVVAVSSLMTIAGMAAFAWIVFRTSAAPVALAPGQPSRHLMEQPTEAT